MEGLRQESIQETAALQNNSRLEQEPAAPDRHGFVRRLGPHTKNIQVSTASTKHITMPLTTAPLKLHAVIFKATNVAYHHA